MLHIMRLELKKFNMFRYVRSAIIANLCVVLFVALVTLDQAEFRNPFEVLSVVDIFVRLIYMIFAAVLISRFIIDEFRTKTITVLFTYPISRKKFMVAKLALIVCFMLVAIPLANLMIVTILRLLGTVPVIPADILLDHALIVSKNTVTATFISLIPIYFGMIKYSTVTTVVTSIILAAFFCSSSYEMSINNIIIIPVIFSLFGIGVCAWAIRRIETDDVLK